MLTLVPLLQIGNEFSAVEALWSQFETVMGTENGDSNGHLREAETEDKQEGPDQEQEEAGNGQG